MKKVGKDLPPVVMVTLNRFYFDKESKQMKKRLEPIKLSPSITVVKEELINEEEVKEEEVKEEENKAKDVTYDLYAIVIHSGTRANSGHYYTIAHDNINNSESAEWKSFNDNMVSEVDADFIETINEKLKYDTPYILFYKERELGVRTKYFSEHSKSLFDIKMNNKVPSPLEKFIKSDSDNYLREKELITLRLNQGQFKPDIQALLEIQKMLMKKNLGKIDEARTMGPGGFGGYGGNNHDFFGGGGGIC